MSLTIRHARTAELSDDELDGLRRMLDEAYGGDFEDDDWEHSLGGVHVIGALDGEVVAHAAVVERRLFAGGRPLRTGYVEAVAVHADARRKGIATALMGDVSAIIRDAFELGALGDGTDIGGFYQRFGWLTWLGPSLVITADGPERTADEDGYILVLLTDATGDLDLTQPLACEWRSGDVW